MPRLEFLLDADMPRSAAEVFRAHGYAVEDVRDLGLGGASDAQIIQHALERGKVIVTRDTDFGEVLRYPRHPGAIILRLPHTFKSGEVAARLEAFLASSKEEDIRGAISIVELDRVRRRPLG